MIEALTAFFGRFPDELAVFLLAMIPITELRAAIPIGIGAFDMSVWSAAFWSLAGNTAIVALLLVILPLLSRIAMRVSWARRFLEWWFASAQRRFSTTNAKYGLAVGLMVFVAIPLPVTGGWTGSLLAFLFRMPYGRALLVVTLGMAIAAVIVSATSAGAFSLFSFRG